MALTPSLVVDELIKQIADRKVCVAYSGGVDSHVLLHLLANASAQYHFSLRAIYVNHGLQVGANDWQLHCQQVCQQLNVPFQAFQVQVNSIKEKGLEAAARDARYQLFSQQLSADEVLVTGQHQQDQAETLMLQLLRGAGPTGLKAMSTIVERAGLTILRPLLQLSKQAILHYAQQHQLQWIDDPSNQNIDLNRNYLRHQVWPVLTQRWPALNNTLARSAAHCQDASLILNEMAIIDANTVCAGNWHQLDLIALAMLSVHRQRNLLRYAIERCGFVLPSTVIVEQILETMLTAKRDREPEVKWQGYVARRFKQTLYLQQDQATESDTTSYEILSTSEKPLLYQRRLTWQPQSGRGLLLSTIEAGLTLRFRRGGEQILLINHQQHKTVKQLFQEWQIPPWQRSQIPLFFAGDTLVAVGRYGYADGYAARENETGWEPQLLPVEQARF